MTTRLAIGDFSRMTYLSVKALRHYHEVGLLAPSQVDPATGYRQYDASQVPVAQVIRRFRELGMPIDDVKAVLQAPDVSTRNRVIVAHLQRMESELANTQSTVASLRNLLEQTIAPIAVEYRSVQPTLVLAITEQVAMDDIEAWWLSSFDELYGVLASTGGTPAGPGGALYPTELFEFELGEVVAFVPVIHEVASSAPPPSPNCLQPSWPLPCMLGRLASSIRPMAPSARMSLSENSGWRVPFASTTWSPPPIPRTRRSTEPRCAGRSSTRLPRVPLPHRSPPIEPRND